MNHKCNSTGCGVIYNNRDLYFDKDMTAEDVCKAMGVGKWYNKRIQRDFYQRLGSKGKGHGGKRRGSGNKKGIEFCGTCRQRKGNCNC